MEKLNLRAYEFRQRLTDVIWGEIKKFYQETGMYPESIDVRVVDSVIEIDGKGREYFDPYGIKIDITYKPGGCSEG